MSNILDNPQSNNSAPTKKQEIRQSDIDGRHFLFHSLPKEFFNLFSNYYILEKKKAIDSAVISSAQLNGYMWMSVFDATKYALILFIPILIVLIKLAFIKSVVVWVIDMLVLTGILLFVGWHFEYYAKMRAKQIDAVTHNLFDHTGKVFYQTFFALLVSLSIGAFVVAFSFDSLLELFQNILLYVKNNGGYSHSYFEKRLFYSGVKTYNFLISVKEMKEHQSLILSILANPYIFLVYINIYSIGFLIFLERYFYKKEEKLKILEIEREKMDNGYPIEYVLKKIHKWRKEYGL